MFGEPTPYPWWLWLLASLWTGGLVLRRVWRVGRETGRLLDGLIAVYTGLLAYMAANATTAAFPSVGWIRAGWWIGGSVALAGTLLCANGDTRRLRTTGWLLATTGLAGMALWLSAPELAVLCGVASVVGLRMPQAVSPLHVAHSSEAGARGLDEDQVPEPDTPDAWLVFVAATLACVTWLGTIEFAWHIEAPRAGVSPRLTALPPITPDTRSPSLGSSIVLAGLVAALAWLAARPMESPEEDDACPPS